MNYYGGQGFGYDPYGQPQGGDNFFGGGYPYYQYQQPAFVPTQDVWSIQRGYNPQQPSFNPTQDSGFFGAGPVPSTPYQPQPFCTPAPDQPNLLPPSDTSPMVKSLLQITDKKRKQKRDTTFYANMLDGLIADSLVPTYTYQYSDGYKADQLDMLQQFNFQNNAKIADSFVPVKDFKTPGPNLPPKVPKDDPSPMNFAIKSSSIGFLLNPENLRDFAIISGQFAADVPAPLREEKNDIPDTPTPAPVVQNSFIETFVPDKYKNELDDLQELVRDSKAIANARASGARFTDPLFPPNIKSIIGFGEGSMRADEWSRFPWLRPDAYFGPRFSVFDTISSGDIEQGSLGDCYFLASISAVAEFPERIERLMLTKKTDPQSVYAVAICHDGLWSDVVLDDLVPCQPVSKQIMFNRSKNKELWVMLLEKAWAKTHGGYQNIAAGLCREALRALTGACCKTFFTSQNREEIWRSIRLGEDMNFIMTAASDNLDNGSDAYQEKIGICGSHAYSLLAAVEIERGLNGVWRRLPPGRKPSGPVERLVQLRNPWGKGEWKGKWSDGDREWTPELRREIGQPNEKDDGIFCITYNDFCKYFSDLQICYYHDKFKYSAVKIKGPAGSRVVLSFRITRPGVFYLSLNQKLSRAFPRNKNYRYSNLGFTVTRQAPDGSSKLIASQVKDDFENWTEQKLETGTYFVEIRLSWTSMVDECSFSIYGEEMCPIAILPEGKLPAGLTAGGLATHARENKKVPVFDFAKFGQPAISYRLFDNQQGSGYVFFDNKSNDTVLNGTVDFSQSDGIILRPPYTGLKPSFVVEPGQNATIAYEAKRLPYKMKMQLTVSFEKANEFKRFTEQVRQSQNVVPRLDDRGTNVGFRVHVLQHQGGIGFLYVNDNPSQTLQERVTFDLRGCHLDGVVGNVLEVVVPSRCEKLFKVVADTPGAFDARVIDVQRGPQVGMGWGWGW